MALETNREIRREAFNLFQHIMRERLETGNMIEIEMEEVARSCILAIKTFQSISTELLGPVQEDCYLEGE